MLRKNSYVPGLSCSQEWMPCRAGETPVISDGHIDADEEPLRRDGRPDDAARQQPLHVRHEPGGGPLPHEAVLGRVHLEEEDFG